MSPPFAVTRAGLPSLNVPGSRLSQGIQFTQPTSDKDYHLLQSGLQGNAPSFGPAATSTHSGNNQDSVVNTPQLPPYTAAASPYYGGYGVQMLNNGLSNMSLGPYQGQVASQPPTQGSYGGYAQYQQPAAPRFAAENNSHQSRAVQQRRGQPQNADGRLPLHTCST